MRAVHLVCLSLALLGTGTLPSWASSSWLSATGLDGIFGRADAADAQSAEQGFLATAHAALDEGDIAAAERYFEAALAANPDSAEALVYLGLIHESLGRVARAEAMYARALSLATLHAAATGGTGPWADIAALARQQIALMHPVSPAAVDAWQHVVARFETLNDLVQRGLVEAAEVEARRTANLGALLPSIAPAPAALLFRSPPPTVDVARRLTDLAAFRERGVMTDAAYQRERTAILDGLVPLNPAERRSMEGVAAPPLDLLLRQGLVTREEAEAELAAVLDGGTFDLDAALAAAPEASPPPPVPTSKPARDIVAAATDTAGDAHPVGLHLASFRTPEQAELGWTEILAANPDVLAGLSPRITEVDRGADTGVFFEVQAGPLPSPESAVAACDTLIRRGLYCSAIAF